MSGLANPLLSKPMEQYLFLRMNHLKFRAARLQSQMERGEASLANRERIEALWNEAVEVRNRILESNLRLAVANAARMTVNDCRLEELVSDCVVPLMRAVELFDVAKGHCFSTYATHVVRNAVRRTAGLANRRAERFQLAGTGSIEPIDRADPAEARWFLAANQLTTQMLEKLSERDRTILQLRFGLSCGTEPMTFEEIGRRVGLSKERVRVIARNLIQQLDSQYRTAFDSLGEEA